MTIFVQRCPTSQLKLIWGGMKKNLARRFVPRHFAPPLFMGDLGLPEPFSPPPWLHFICIPMDTSKLPLRRINWMLMGMKEGHYNALHHLFLRFTMQPKLSTTTRIFASCFVERTMSFLCSHAWKHAIAHIFML